MTYIWSKSYSQSLAIWLKNEKYIFLRILHIPSVHAFLHACVLCCVRFMIISITKCWSYAIPRSANIDSTSEEHRLRFNHVSHASLKPCSKQTPTNRIARRQSKSLSVAGRIVGFNRPHFAWRLKRPQIVFKAYAKIDYTKRIFHSVWFPYVVMWWSSMAEEVCDAWCFSRSLEMVNIELICWKRLLKSRGLFVVYNKILLHMYSGICLEFIG